jgi:hypothetical protein
MLLRFRRSNKKLGRNSMLAVAGESAANLPNEHPLKPSREGLIKSPPETFMLAVCLPEAGVCQS